MIMKKLNSIKQCKISDMDYYYHNIDEKTLSDILFLLNSRGYIGCHVISLGNSYAVITNTLLVEEFSKLFNNDDSITCYTCDDCSTFVKTKYNYKKI